MAALLQNSAKASGVNVLHFGELSVSELIGAFQNLVYSRRRMTQVNIGFNACRLAVTVAQML